MMIEINAAEMDGIVRAWLKDTLDILETNLSSSYVHPDDYKTYKKDIKAVKRLLDYIGEQP
jgi:hypothetical protein